jgi:hypothetical protein
MLGRHIQSVSSLGRVVVSSRLPLITRARTTRGQDAGNVKSIATQPAKVSGI